MQNGKYIKLDIKFKWIKSNLHSNSLIRFDKLEV